MPSLKVSFLLLCALAVVLNLARGSAVARAQATEEAQSRSFELRPGVTATLTSQDRTAAAALERAMRAVSPAAHMNVPSTDLADAAVRSSGGCGGAAYSTGTIGAPIKMYISPPGVAGCVFLADGPPAPVSCTFVCGAVVAEKFCQFQCGGVTLRLSGADGFGCRVVGTTATKPGAGFPTSSFCRA